jgi:glutathione S-transferase
MPHAQLTLISHPLCPFVQRAAIVLLEKNVPFERIDVDLAAKPDWFLTLSPMGKVPLLKVELPDRADAILFESMAICEYLNETQGGVSLYSNDALSRAQQRSWVEFVVAVLSDAWQFLNASDLAIADGKKAAFRDKLQQLEGKLGQEPYFAGSAFGMVDAVFAPVFRYFDVLGPIEATARAELYVEAVEQMQQQVQVMMEAMLKPWAALMAPFVDRNRGR